MNKITDIRANAHSSTFGFCLHAKPKQKPKELEFLPTLDRNEIVALIKIKRQ